MGGGDKSPHILKLDTRRKSQHHTRATLSTGTETSMSMQQKVQWATELIWASWKREKKTLSPARHNHNTSVIEPMS